MLAEANIVVLVGPEGHGKSTLMRQMAVQCASGLVPFTAGRMEPLKCMYVDAENPESQQMLDWRKLAGLASRHIRQAVPNDNLHIFSEWREEPDLLTADGQMWLFERISAHRPQVCFIGPVQNVVGRDVKDDEVVRKFKRAINQARAICGTAFVIEHHPPHRAPQDKERVMRPYGSSLFMKWPDFGYGLKPTEEGSVYELFPFRRPRVRSRAWPDRLRWGLPNSMEFPWEIAEPDGVNVTGTDGPHGLHVVR
jgi:replicative DNA helicase